MSTQPPAGAGSKKPAPIVAIKDYVTARASNLAAALKGTGVDVDRFLVLALNQTLQTPLLLQCTPASWFDAMQKAATHGLLPDGIHAALVPYKFTDKDAKPTPVSEYRVQFMPMYQGLVQRAFQTGQVGKIWARVVYQDDDFEVQEGDDPRIKHVPHPTGDRNDDKLVAAYACAKIGPEVVFVVLFARDIKRHENSSKTADSKSSPWQTAKAEMWKKTAIISLSKTLPHFNAKGMKYAALVNESEREDLNLPAPIDVNFLPEPGPTGLDPLREKLRAEAEAKVERTTQAIASDPDVKERVERAMGHPADADDAEKEEPTPVVVPPGKREDGSTCMHESMRGARIGAARKRLCPECDAELSQTQCDALGPA